jgi:hypothetical protein
MPADHLIDIINPAPGIQRDGTQFDTNLYTDGQWVRFYRGRAKSIGGQVLLNPGNHEIIRNVYNVDQNNNVTDCYLGRSSSLDFTSVLNGISNPEIDRTPVGFIANPDNNWTFDRYTLLNVVSSTVNLGNNPLTTTNNSNIVVVSVPSTVGLRVGQLVTISNAVGFNGLFEAQLNISTTITNIVANISFSYSVAANATTGGSGGGNGITYSLSSAVNYIIAHAAQNVTDMNNSVESLIYWGDTSTATPLTIMSPNAPQLASGGIVVLYPYFFKYTNDGVVAFTLNPGGDWSDAIYASISGTKIVKGLITRGGSNAPSGLFWSLNALIKATFVGGDTVFQFDTIQEDISLLSQNCIVTCSNVFYWIGHNQFYLYNGVVKKIPNNTNRVTFFKNLNFKYRNKVWGMYKEEYNEIWWYYPSGNNTECDSVIIYNVDENFWFDTRHSRSAGSNIGLYPYPLEADSEAILNKFNPTSTVVVDLANNPITTVIGSTVVTVTIPENKSLKNGMLVNITGETGFNGITAPQLNQVSTPITVIDGTSFTYIAGAAATGSGSGGGNAVSYSYLVPNLCYGLWQEETGTDRVLYGQSLAIQSFYETNIISWFEKYPSDDRQMRIRRIEPDFVQKQPMTMSIITRDFAQTIPQTSKPYTFLPGQEIVTLSKIDTNNMGRLVNFRFESNIKGGSYEMGKIVLSYAPGDVKP